VRPTCLIASGLRPILPNDFAKKQGGTAKYAMPPADRQNPSAESHRKGIRPDQPYGAPDQRERYKTAPQKLFI